MIVNCAPRAAKCGIRAAIATVAALAAMWGCGQSRAAEENGRVLGALAKANLAKPRPPAPVDLTGTYNFKIEGTDADSHDFLPLPKLTPAAQAVRDKILAYRAKGFDYLTLDPSPSLRRMREEQAKNTQDPAEVVRQAWLSVGAAIREALQITRRQASSQNR